MTTAHRPECRAPIECALDEDAPTFTTTSFDTKQFKAHRYAARLLLPRFPDLLLVEASHALGGRIKQVLANVHRWWCWPSVHTSRVTCASASKAMKQSLGDQLQAQTAAQMWVVHDFLPLMHW